MSSSTEEVLKGAGQQKEKKQEKEKQEKEKLEHHEVVDEEEKFLQKDIQTLEKANEVLEQQLKEKESALDSLKRKVTNVQFLSEKEEENITNSFFRKLDQIKRENSQLSQRIHFEETSTQEVLRNIALVRNQREEIENKLEFEQEGMMHKLQKQLLELSTEKRSCEQKLHEERATFLQRLQEKIGELQTSMGVGSPRAGGSMSESSPQLAASLQEASSEKNDGKSLSSPAILDSAESIIQLESELDGLVSQEFSAEQTNEKNAFQCETLTAKLKELQLQAFLAKVKTKKLKEDLERAQQELSFEKEYEPRIQFQAPRSPSASMASNSSFEMDTTSASSLSLTGTSQLQSAAGGPLSIPGVVLKERDLRAHTERVLSSATPTHFSGGSVRRTPPPTPPHSARSHTSSTATPVTSQPQRSSSTDQKERSGSRK